MQNLPEVQLAVTALKQKLSEAGRTGRAAKPRVGIVLGTGLSGLVAAMRDAVRVPYGDLPGFPVSTVDSHSGAFVLGDVAGIPVLAQQGRCHLYEGYSPAQVCMGVRVMAGLGIGTLVVTNAAGALNPQFDAGSLMLMTDQINFTGATPLAGPNVEQWGPRFPDMSCIFDPELRTLALESAAMLGIRLERGVYIGVRGPQMESPAETRMYRQWGADAIGMSTVLEVLAARHLGLRVLGISCLSNKNLPDCMAPVPIEEVIEVAGKAGRRLEHLLLDMVTKF